MEYLFNDTYSICSSFIGDMAFGIRCQKWKGGRIEGRTEGAASKIIELVIKKHQKGYTAEDTADMLEEPVSRIRQIYDVIEKSSPDYDAETIYKQLCEKEE